VAAFFEIRRYQVRPGRREEWLRYMADVVLPFQVAQGMTVIGEFVDEQDPDGYVWIRRFEDEADRERLYAAVYDSDRWKQEISPVIGGLLLRELIVVTRVVPTAGSALR
jgi:hypothetical protein